MLFWEKHFDLFHIFGEIIHVVTVHAKSDLRKDSAADQALFPLRPKGHKQWRAFKCGKKKKNR